MTKGDGKNRKKGGKEDERGAGLATIELNTPIFVGNWLFCTIGAQHAILLCNFPKLEK